MPKLSLSRLVCAIVPSIDNANDLEPVLTGLYDHAQLCPCHVYEKEIKHSVLEEER